MDNSATQDDLIPANVFRFYVCRDLDPDHGFKVRRLWLAVLQRALQDYVQAQHAGTPNEELVAWFSSPEEGKLGSYRSICSILDIDGDRLLKQLPEISEEGLRGLRKSGLDDVY